ncbi:MAG: hypothetical protein KBA51_04580 [Kiritimatiellae bacterium]|nr:hypothetical protein [Kiritimatiellia bacterium]
MTTMPRPLAALVGLGIGIGAIALASRSHAPLSEFRREQGLVPAADPLENAPPLVAFTTVALGGFRGIAADILWLRAVRLQDHGQYIELVTLADWITKLQPRMPGVWVFQGWNLAFNISVMFERPEDRWRWVQHGIRLLRDEGLKYCPGQSKLYQELSWFFNFKIGEDMDDAHRLYKREWARQMEHALGGPRPDFDALSRAPSSPDELERSPSARAWLDAMRGAGLDPYDPAWLDPRHGPPSWRERRTTDPGAAEWIAFLRARALHTQYRLDPRAMAEVDAEYGPFDWRTPDAHAVYWAAQGLPFARTDFQRLQLERSRFQAMAASFVRGRFHWTDTADGYALAPNLDLLPAVRRAYEQTLARAPDNESVVNAYRNFLRDAILLCYSYNRQDQARRLFDDYHTRFAGDGSPADLESFVAGYYSAFIENLTPGQANAAVEAALYQSLFWDAVGDPDQAAGYERIALLIWQSWMGERTDPRLTARVGLPPLGELREQAARRVRDALSRSSNP